MWWLESSHINNEIQNRDPQVFSKLIEVVKKMFGSDMMKSIRIYEGNIP
jgi:hypothetical protein